MPTGGRAAAAAALALLAGTAPAAAGPPGKWTQVTGLGRDDSNIMEVGLARTGDGVLHVLWTRGAPGSVVHSSISPDARSLSRPHTVFENPDGVNETVDVVRAPDGSLRAFFAAVNAFDGAMIGAASADGVSWSGRGPVSKTGTDRSPVYAAGGIGAAVGTDGTFYSIWGDSAPGGGGFHAGLDPAVPDGDLPGGLKRDPDVGADSQTGRVVAGWNSLDGEGVVIMPLSPAGGHGSIPNSAPQLQHRLGITGRIGAPGVFVAFARGSNPFLSDPAVYRTDTGRVVPLTRRDGELVSIAAAPQGRLWVFWRDGGTIRASRSNRAATRFGAFVKLRAPKKATTIYNLAGEGSRGPLDLLAHVDPPTGTLSSWHQRILPGLSFRAKQSTQGKTAIKVTDAGEAVAGAKVKVKGVGSKTTGPGGTVSFGLAAGKYRVVAAKAGYSPASGAVRISARP
jgi:hypothetical protein